jgi:PAS domain S-box-containing protein
MGTSGSTPDVTREDTRSVFASSNEPGAPLTTAEVAERLDCPEQHARQTLEALEERGEIRSRSLDGDRRIWWRPEAGTDRDGERSDLAEFGAFVNAVEEYAVFTLDPDGTVASWNERAERIKGYAEEAIVGEHFSVFYTDEDVEAGIPDENLEAAATDGRVEDAGWRVRADGSRFWADVAITAIHEDGELQGFTKVTRDTTERRAYQQRLRQERDLTDQILETAPVSIAVVTAEGDLVRANQRVIDRLGIEDADPREFDVDFLALYDEDGEVIPVDQRPWNRVSETGDPVTDAECQIDLPELGRRWLSITAAPLETTVGRDRVVVTVDDVTEQKERERRLRREYKQTEQLLRTAPVGIAVQNADRETVIANRRAQEDLGISEAEFVDDPVDDGEWEIYDTDGEPLAQEETPSARALDTGEPVYDEELVLDPPDGEPMHFRINAAPLVGADGTVERIVIAGDEITELKERERQIERRQTELETELGEIFDRISDAFYALDEEWRFTHVNDRAAEILQHSPEELRGQRIWDVLPGARDGVYGEKFRAALEAQEPVTFEVYSDNVDAWLEFNAYPSESGLSIYFQDITDRKERERELERIERRFEAIFEDPNILIGLLDTDGTVLDVNETAMEYVESGLDDVTGELFWETPWWGERDEVREDVKRWTERAAAGEYVDFEADLTRPDGDQYTLNGVFRPVTDDQGDVVSVIVSDRDVTERKRRERELEESERRYRTLVENFPNGAVALVDDDLRYQTVGGNPLDVANLTAEEVEGKRVSEVLPPSLANELVPHYEAALAGEPGEFEQEIGDRIFQFQVVPVRDAAGTVFAALGMSQDITEQRDQRRKIEESERRYRTLVENFPGGAVGLFDEDLCYTAVGGELLDELDLSPDDRVGVSIAEIHPDELLAEIEPNFRAALRGESTSFEVEYRGRYLRANTLPVSDSAGNVSAGMLVVQDVTERREAQQEVRESEAKFRMLAENLAEIVWMTTGDAEEFVYVNPAFEEVWEMDREDLYEEPLSFLDAVHRDDRDRVRTAFSELPDDDFDEEFRIHQPDGELRWVHARGTRIYDPDSDMVRVVGIGEDVTQRVERERELERALDLLERTQRIADVGGWEIDVDTNDVFWTDYVFELLEVDGEEEPSLDQAIDMYHEEDRPLVEEAVEQALTAGEPLDVEVRLRTAASGDVRWLRLQGVPETVDGETVSLRGAAQDVTERKQRERRLEELIEKLEASNERLEQFAYAASHDLQEPLRMVSSYLQLIENRYAEALDDDGREFIEFAVDGAERMREMIEGLLQYSRVDTRGDPFEPVDLNEVLTDVRDDLQVRIDESGAEITTEELPQVHGDAGQLRQVLQNLLDNAIEYSGASAPRVHVAAERDGDWWEISVRDEGIGIDPADSERVFDVFQSLHAQDEYSGTGIGLALCERIVERHGGDIWVDSEPGEGATFTLTLPASETE